MPVSDPIALAHATPGPCSCPVAEIPGWFWRALDLPRALQSGVYAPGTVDALSWHESEIARASVEAARAHRKQAQAEIDAKLRGGR